MITITEDQAHQVKSLLEQAIQGNHILFEPQLERLDQTTIDLVVKTYFNIVENRLLEDSRKATH